MANRPGYITAGGRSRRFGSDKARILVQGQPLLLRVANTVAQVCQPVIVVADREGKYDDLGWPTIADVMPGMGPLAGLHAAMHHHRAHHGPGWLLLCACDHVVVQPHWLTHLWQQVMPRQQHQQTRDDIQAVVYRGEHWQTLLALYHTDLLDRIEAQLQSGERSLRLLLEQTAACQLPLPDDWPDIVQINTRDELKQYLDQT